MPQLHLLWLWILVLATVSAAAQENAASPWSSETLQQLHQLQEAALNDDYGYPQAAHLTDNIGPRLAGSSQAAAAVEYVAAELRKLGLEVTLEPVSVPKWVRGEERAELVSYPGQAPGTQQKIVVTALASVDNATPAEGITAEIVVVNSFDELAAMSREKVAGKIVVFNEPFDHQMVAAGFGLAAYGQAVAYRENGRAAAAKQGAVAALVRSAGAAEFRLPHTGETGYDPKLPSIPAAAVTAEDAELMARLAAEGPVRLHLVMTAKLLPNVTSYNVVADLKGSEHPEQVVIVSGHLDSWDLGTGALDDAAGVAVSMATAQLLRQLHLQPKRTIRIVAWMAEETGIFGGKAYAKQHANDVANHFAAIETDLGAGHPMGINVSGDEAVLKLLQPVADVLATSGTGMLQPSDETGADIIPLKVAGVPSFSPIQDERKYFDYHHTAADTLDKIDPKELRENATVVAVLAYALATMDTKLPRKPQPMPDWLK
jgi:Zn-dependent M28 family amino/carboxypeptidase